MSGIDMNKNMKMDTEQLCTIKADDAHIIRIRYWSAETDVQPTVCSRPRAIVVVSHGMAEHSRRYAPLGQFLGRHGFMTICHDHRGHGPFATHLGHYADKDGWKKVWQDLAQVIEAAALRHPGVPIVLLGHSMGSFIAQAALMNRRLPVKAAIFSGSNLSDQSRLSLGKVAARGSRVIFGLRKPNPLLHHLSFGHFNKHIEQPNTDHDWLSRDPETVSDYLNDPYCGQVGTTQLWLDFLSGLQAISTPANVARMPAIPYLLFAGDDDPVGNHGKGVLALGRLLRSKTSDDVSTRLYRHGRHEMLNETNRQEVFDDLLQWLVAKVHYTEQQAA
ncbi:MAG: hypothetical protein CME36_08910 [unclassified Hahellaceae]|nr:hypothetical protein [Hahellaceae bacterium]|tara:strand:- start:16676 stop:17671 length:996 start_codon:yes stop_codon:yes gene_type:complete